PRIVKPRLGCQAPAWQRQQSCLKKRALLAVASGACHPITDPFRLPRIVKPRLGCQAPAWQRQQSCLKKRALLAVASGACHPIPRTGFP
ncbi:MAG: hypothetical protein PHY41_07325, partial [Candidatus Cloacimonetes bacterium]|nr:hypothetical protein [Candidatus Cloacimonadota bacterium]